MIAMGVQDEWVSVAKAAEIAGCSEQYVRRDLLDHLVVDAKGNATDRTSGGRLDGWLVHGRAWLVSRESAVALRHSLTSRAKINRGIKPAPRASRRKKPRQRSR